MLTVSKCTDSEDTEVKGLVRNPKDAPGRCSITSMTARVDYAAVAPDSTKGLTEIERYIRNGPLSAGLLELVRLRASQINGCAYCLDLHYRRARRAGVPEIQLDTLDGWPESPAFSDKERAALLWTESLTQVSVDHVPDSAWDAVRAHFSAREIVDLSIAIADINAWNRLMIAFRTPPTFGSLQKSSTAALPPAVPSPAVASTPDPASSG
jgi:AhpD family alkylhydroperoxidase